MRRKPIDARRRPGPAPAPDAPPPGAGKGMAAVGRARARRKADAAPAARKVRRSGPAALAELEAVATAVEFRPDGRPEERP